MRRSWPLALALIPALAAQARRKKVPEPIALDAGVPDQPKAERPEHPIDIRSDHGTLLPKEHVGIFKGHVHAVRPGEKGQPDLHILCDQATTHYQGDNKVQTIICEGSVEVIQGDRKGWGDRGEFNNDLGNLVVTGSPHGQQGPNRFAGKVLTFFTNDDRVEVDQAVVEGETEGRMDGRDGGARDAGGPRTFRSLDGGRSWLPWRPRPRSRLAGCARSSW